jgi:hypothetical protein
MIKNSDDRRLELPSELVGDDQAIELVAIWFVNDKVKVITRTGTSLDQQPLIWGEILAALGDNIARSIEQATGKPAVDTMVAVKNSLDHNWQETVRRSHKRHPD